MSELRRAVILAGGAGRRLRPYTTVLPKPLMPIGDRPILDVVVRQLRRFGVEHITMATGHLAELIEAFFRNGEAYDLHIDYFVEHEPLGTVGALPMIDGLEGDFLVMNGDVLSDLDYSAVFRDHVESGAAATIATTTREVQITLGVIHTDDPEDANRLTGYSEKPVVRHDVSMGVYCFAQRALEYIECGQPLDFPDLVLKLVAAGELVRAWPSSDYWLDIGRPEDYERALDDFERLRDRFIPPE
ncbi:MAG: sugar phosphate nucleotidyltransferase [Solirubrobacteraceae bacterium]